MENKKSFWSTISGGISSFLPFLAACCGIGCAGSCGVVCVAPIAAALGLSSVSIFLNQWWDVLFPLMIALSSVSFTAAYFTIYKTTVGNISAGNECNCSPLPEARPSKFVKLFFLISLVLSIAFYSYTIYSRISDQHETLKQGTNKENCSGCSGSDTNSVKKVNSSCSKSGK